MLCFSRVPFVRMFASSWHRPGGTGGTGQAMAWPIFQPTCIKSLHDTACLLTRNCIAKYLSCFVTVWSIGFTSYIGIVQSAIIIIPNQYSKLVSDSVLCAGGGTSIPSRTLPLPVAASGHTLQPTLLSWLGQYNFASPSPVALCVVSFISHF